MIIPTQGLQKCRVWHSWSKPPFHAVLPEMLQEHLHPPSLDCSGMAQKNLCIQRFKRGLTARCPRLPDISLCQKADFLFLLKEFRLSLPAIYFSGFLHSTRSGVAINNYQWEGKKKKPTNKPPTKKTNPKTPHHPSRCQKTQCPYNCSRRRDPS